MIYDDNIEQLIEGYVMGTLSEEGVMMVEEKIKTDVGFAEEVQLFRELTKMVEIVGDLEMKQRFQAIDKSLQVGNRPTRLAWLGRRSWLALAASILIIVVAVMWFLKPNSANTAAIFTQHFEPYQMPLSTQSESPDIAKPWTKAMQFYLQGDYNAATPLLEQLTQKPTSQIYQFHFYLGICQMAQAPPDLMAAIENFDIVQQANKDYVPQATWYMGLAYLKLGKNKVAKAIFKSIVNANQPHYKKESALKILKQLK